jgi:hypothetical protein
VVISRSTDSEQEVNEVFIVEEQSLKPFKAPEFNQDGLSVLEAPLLFVTLADQTASASSTFRDMVVKAGGKRGLHRGRTKLEAF